jgi:hypothetical protein
VEEEMSLRMSETLRIELEFLYGQLLSDSPYCSPEGMSRLKRILGYATDVDGYRVDESSADDSKAERLGK